MFKSLCRGTALATVALGLASGAVQAGGLANLDLQSSPTYAGAQGNYAVLILQYDSAATGPLLVKSVKIGDPLGRTAFTQQVVNCGTAISTVGPVTTYAVNPGQICFVKVNNISGYFVDGEIIVADGSATTKNMLATVRAMMEVRDVNNSVITHAELR
jgi:hypothetical protein